MLQTDIQNHFGALVLSSSYMTNCWMTTMELNMPINMNRLCMWWGPGFFWHDPTLKSSFWYSTKCFCLSLNTMKQKSYRKAGPNHLLIGNQLLPNKYKFGWVNQIFHSKLYSWIHDRSTGSIISYTVVWLFKFYDSIL